MSREALVLLVCCCDFRDRAERLIPSKSLRNAVIRAFPGLFCILRMCAPRRAAAVVRPRGREKSADRRRRILISRLLIIRTSVPRRKSPFPAYFKGFPAVSPLIPPYPAFLKYPVSPHAARKLTRAAAEFDGPVYLRFTRDAVPEVYGPEQEFVIGKAITLREGTDAAIISIGDTVHIALEAAEELLKQGIKARVLDMHTIKPLDVEAVTKAVNECGKIVTVEDHNIINGLGSAVASIAADMGRGIVKRIGILDQFGQSAPYERLLEMNGITVENIVSIVKGI